MTAASSKNILFIQTGGTIDKEYPKTIGGYNFEIGDPAIDRAVARVKPTVGFSYRSKSICQKDSQEIDQTDRDSLAKCITEATERRIVVTHGTDTIIDTGKFLQKELRKFQVNSRKNVILVGSFIPERFKDSDADINIGAALGALDAFDILAYEDIKRCNKSTDVYISLGGRVIPAEKAVRNSITGLFCHCDEMNVPGECK